MNYRDTEDECPGCGSTMEDRRAFAQRNMGTLTGLSMCPHCITEKCCMCDMGDDVRCISCETTEPEN